jgi:hypothetical protein
VSGECPASVRPVSHDSRPPPASVWFLQLRLPGQPEHVRLSARPRFGLRFARRAISGSCAIHRGTRRCCPVAARRQSSKGSGRAITAEVRPECLQVLQLQSDTRFTWKRHRIAVKVPRWQCRWSRGGECRMQGAESRMAARAKYAGAVSGVSCATAVNADSASRCPANTTSVTYANQAHFCRLGRCPAPEPEARRN